MSDHRQDIMFSIAKGVFLGNCGVCFLYCLEEDLFYIYEDGVWRPIFEVELLSIITNTEAFNYVHKYTISHRKQIIENLKLLIYKPLSQFNTKGLLNFPSGLLDPIDNNFLAHSPDVLSTIRLPYKYDQLAKCELWNKTLLEIFDNDVEKINILQEFFGYCLTHETKFEKALLLLGESRTGKSTILYVLRHVIGVKNCSSVPLKFISNPQYTPSLINKLVNIDTDVSGKAQEFEQEFKVITSGEPVQCNQKFVASFDFNPYCKLVMAANEFPRITDHSSAFYKRLILIPCERVFEEHEINNNLKDDLLDELSGILNWSMVGLHRLMRRGRFEHNQFMVDAITELRQESNPVDIFFSEWVETDVSGNVELPKEEIYKKYQDWCAINGNSPLANNKFGAMVYRKYSKFTPRNTMSHRLMKRVWKNLKLINHNEVTDQEISWQDRP